MRRRSPTWWPLAALLLGAAVAAVVGAEHGDARPAGGSATVASITDGDTLRLTSGARVRLVQVDTPEVGSGDCYSRAAARELRRLVPPGTAVGLQADARLDRADRYGRLLRYVWRGPLNVNLELVRRGAATVWLYDGERGKYAARLLAAARSARAAGRGLWGACRAVWDPHGPARTVPRSRPAGEGSPPRRGCDESYVGVCIPPPPPDLDCADVRSLAPFAVRGADPHRFDGDRDGVGCE